MPLPFFLLNVADVEEVTGPKLESQNTKIDFLKLLLVRGGRDVLRASRPELYTDWLQMEHLGDDFAHILATRRTLVTLN